MDSGESRIDRARAEAALNAAHAIDMERAKERYKRELQAFIEDFEDQVAALRRRSAKVLARIVSEYEKERALSIAHWQLGREHLRGEGSPKVFGGKV